MTSRENVRDDRGSTIPLILGFVVIALLMVAGSLAAGDAFVQQRDLQDVCDGAATAAAATALDLGRGADPLPADAARFGAVDAALADYLAGDSSRSGVQIASLTSADGRTLTLRCVRIESIVFGAVFGQGGGVRHVVTSSVEAPIS